MGEKKEVCCRSRKVRQKNDYYLRKQRIGCW